MLQSITVNGNAVSIVVLPSAPGLRSVEFDFEDAVASNVSPFTGQTQTQEWFGADKWSGMATLPPLSQCQADQWISALMECRGIAIPFLMGDPLKTSPAGNLQGSVPLIDNSVSGCNQTGAQLLNTKGWAASAFRLLLPGDYVQVGYRLHRNLDVVNSDASGKATLSLWPSLREGPVDSTAVILNNPQGLFRRADNKRTWSADITRLSRLSFPFAEYR
jgi:hypothetical protein